MRENMCGKLAGGMHQWKVKGAVVAVLAGFVLAAPVAQAVRPTIAGGYTHSLALKSDGTVKAWGGNGDGQLGNGNNTDTNVPVSVTGLSNVVAVAGGFG